MLTTVLTNGNPGISRIFTWLKVILSHPLTFLRLLNPFGFARSTIVLLVMQNLDGRIRMRLKRSWLPPGKRLETEIVKEDIPTYIPQANAFAEKMAAQVGGTPVTSLPEIFFDVPTTAHILGGAIMAAGPEEGVVDSEGRVFHYKNMYVCDGSVIGANLGVNPGLSITALTEHAMSYIKPANEANWNVG